MPNHGDHQQICANCGAIIFTSSQDSHIRDGKFTCAKSPKAAELPERVELLAEAMKHPGVADVEELHRTQAWADHEGLLQCRQLLGITNPNDNVFDAVASLLRDNQELREDKKNLLTACRGMLASASPNESEHPTMAVAYRFARQIISALSASGEKNEKAEQTNDLASGLNPGHVEGAALQGQATRRRSVAYWPKGTMGGDDISIDCHDTRDAAVHVCRMLSCEGFGGERKVFPLETEVIPEGQRPTLGDR